MDEIASANIAASDLVKIHLNDKNKELEKQLSQKLKVIQLKKATWHDIVTLQDPKDWKEKQGLRQMIKRKATRLIESE